MEPMTMLAVARGLSEFVPGLVRWIGGDQAGDVAEQAVEVARRVTGADAPDDALEAIRRNPELQIQLQQAMNPIIIARLEADTRRLETVNATMRAEASSQDRYVRRWRPTFGYLVAVSWFIQMLAISIAVIKAPEQIGAIISNLAQLTTMWGIALAVLGINVSKRSQDKQVAAGQSPPRGILQGIAERISARHHNDQTRVP